MTKYPSIVTTPDWSDVATGWDQEHFARTQPRSEKRARSWAWIVVLTWACALVMFQGSEIQDLRGQANFWQYVAERGH